MFLLSFILIKKSVVTKVIYRLAHKRKCVFRDVRIKTKVSAQIAESVFLGIGKFCRCKRLSKRKKVVYLEQELTV